MTWLGSTPLKLRASIRFNELNGNVEYLKSIELTEPVICILGKVFNGTGESESERYIIFFENMYYGFFGKVHNDTGESERDNRYTYIHIMVFVMTF